MKTRVVLCDRRRDVVEAWEAQFAELPEVERHQGDVFLSEAAALVLPGNSFGFLDRGLELQLCERFGWEVQDRLRELIRSRHHGELLVGQAAALPLEADREGTPRYRWLIYAPVRRTPQRITGTLNAYLAARAAFLLAAGAEAPIERMIVPGLGTGEEGLLPLISARQVRYAYELASGKRGPGDKNLTQLMRRERKLKSLPRQARGEEG
jgi:O-acetyl-ADP-ribose deacetylase (regulator of RNase III)